MSNVIKRIENFPIQFGGAQHAGWLPHGDAQPLATPVHNLVLDLTIESDGGSGYLVCFESHDGSMCADNWFDSLGAAIQGARDMFGVQPDQWQDAR